MNRPRWLILTILLAIAVSCGEPNPGAPADADLALVLTTDTVFVIGESPAEEGGNYLGRVVSMGFDQRGDIHILDPDRYRVTTWNDRGEFVRQFGNRGEGPSEFQVPRYSFTLRNGSVIVVDIGQSALQVFGPSGQYQRGVRMPTRGGRPAPGNRSVFAGGRLVGVDDYWLSRPPWEGQGIPLFAYSFTADTVESVLYHEAWQRPSDQEGLAMLPTVRIAGFPDGPIALADSVGYRVKILSENGEVTSVIERPVPPLSVTDIAKEAERERRRGRMSGRTVTRSLQDMAATVGISVTNVDVDAVVEDYVEKLNDLQFTDEIPVIRDLAVDWNGRIWITRSDAAGADGPIDLMEADGRYVGTLFDTRRPDAFGPDGLLAYINDHELGTQSVVVVRITSIAPAVEN